MLYVHDGQVHAAGELTTEYDGRYPSSTPLDEVSFDASRTPAEIAAEVHATFGEATGADDVSYDVDDEHNAGGHDSYQKAHLLDRF